MVTKTSGKIYKKRRFKFMYIYPRVTEIIKQTKSKESLKKIDWWNKNTSENCKEDALRRGTEAHQLIDQYIKSGSCYESEDFKKVLPFLKFHRQNIAISERHVICHNLRYEGTADILMILNDKPTVLDWTFTKRTKKKEWLTDKFIQCAAYAIAYEEEKGIKIEQLAVANISYKLNLFVEPDELFKSKWLEKVETFYKNYELSQNPQPK